MRLISGGGPSGDRTHDSGGSPYYDGASGLPTRALFEDRLGRALAGADRSRGKLAVLLLSLADVVPSPAVAARVAEVLRQHTRREDSVARLGEREFGVLLPSLNHAEGARHVARKVMRALAGAGPLLEGMAASMGISVFPDDGDDAGVLVRCAERAAYHAGRTSLGYDWYRHDLDLVPEAVSLYGALRSALERRELALEYQPQVDLATGRVCGVEALVRWPRGQGGTVPANEIIAVAEASGLSGALAEWVLTTACQQMRAWHDAGVLVVRLAVNVSGVQLRQDTLAALVSVALASSGVPPGGLEIELSNATLMSDEGFVPEAVASLKQLGVRVAVDDFGGGRTSLARLGSLPVDSLKLDRAVVAGLDEGHAGTRLVAGIIALAHHLDLAVIAEGVETTSQLAALRAAGCDVLQGFLFSPPVGPDQLASLVRDGRSLDLP